MKKILGFSMMAVFLMANLASAYTLNNMGVTVDVDAYGQVTTFSVGGGPDVMDIQKAVIAYATTSAGALTVMEIDNTWSLKSAATSTGYVWTQIEKNLPGMGGKNFQIEIETRINASTYFDQRYRISFLNGGSTIYNVRLLTYLKTTDVCVPGQITHSTEHAATSPWKSVQDVTSTWNSEPSVTWPGLLTPNWDNIEPDFLAISGSVPLPVGHRGKSPGLTDDYLGGNATNVWNAVLTGDITTGITSPVGSPAIAREYVFGDLTSPAFKYVDQRTEALPEPTTMLLLGVGLVGVGCRRLTKKTK